MIVRTCVSESTAVEIGWKVAGGSSSRHDEWDKIVLVKTDPGPIKTTMLRNAHVVDQSDLSNFFNEIVKKNKGPVRIYLRYDITQACPEEAAKVQSACDSIKALSDEYGFVLDNFKDAATASWQDRSIVLEQADVVMV